MSSRIERALPGEKLAVVEEFEGGDGTYTMGELVRASSLGRAIFEMKERRVKIEPIVNKARIPSTGDSVVGAVESIQSSLANIRIETVNGERSSAGFKGMLISENQRGRRTRKAVVAKPWDVIRATVVSNENSTIQLALNGQDDGVLYTICSVCGGGVVKLGRRVKCNDCGFTEERELAPDFGR